MIRFTTVATQTVLLLSISLLAPLHGAGDAPAHGGAGGGSTQISTSARRGAPSSSIDLLLGNCQANLMILKTWFPSLGAGTVPSQPSTMITDDQHVTLQHAAQALHDITDAITSGTVDTRDTVLDSCDALADNITFVMLSVALPDTGDDAMELEQVIAAYNEARTHTATAPKAMPAVINKHAQRAINRLPYPVQCLASSFLPAPDQAALAQVSQSWRESFQDNLAAIASKIVAPDGITLIENEKKLYAQAIVKTSQQPNDTGSYGISLPVAMKLLTKATAKENAAEIEQWTTIVTELINTHHAPFRRAFTNANNTIPLTATAEDHRATAVGDLAAIATEDLLNRMALCFAWHQRFPRADNLSEDINFQEIIAPEEIIDEMEFDRGVCFLDFASIIRLAHHEKLTQLILDFILATKEPIEVMITNAHAPLMFISSRLITFTAYRNSLSCSLNFLGCPQLKKLMDRGPSGITALNLPGCPHIQTIYISDNPLLTTLDFTNCPQLEFCSIVRNRLLTALNISQCQKLQRFLARNNPLLTALDFSNCHEMQELYAPNNPILTTIDFSGSSKLISLNANHNPRLHVLDVSCCPLLETLSCNEGNPELTVLGLSNCPRLSLSLGRWGAGRAAE